MFLTPASNPHRGGELTGAIFLQTAIDQTFAIDAEWLHREPKLLNAFNPHMSKTIRALDAFAFLLCGLSVIASIMSVWWMFAPGALICMAMIGANRKSAGEIARRAAERSTDAFRHLHEIGAMWLVKA